MSRFLMTTFAGAGNVPPMASVAGALVDRGHEVHVVCDELVRGDFEAAGATFAPWERPQHRTAHGRDGDAFRDWEPDGPLEQLARLRDRVTAGPAGLHAAETADALRSTGADVLLCEQLLLGPLIAAEAAGVPAVLLNCTVDLAPAPGRPPFGPGLLPASTDEERAQHAAIEAAGMAIWAEGLPAVNAARAERGLAPLAHPMEQLRSAARVLVMTSRAFDYDVELPPVVRYTGPRLDDAAWAHVAWSEPEGDGPLVLASLSSDFQDQEDVLRRIVAALGALPVRGLVTTGLGVDPGVAGPPPANVTVTAAAPHRAVLRSAAACVTHCGHGTTLKALAAGVPLVGLPMGRDQHDVAARVVHRGAGLRLDAAATPERIAGAVRRVLAEPSFTIAARRLAAAIAEETREDRVVLELEALVAEVVAPA